MAIKYVENYRNINGNTNDSQVIQAAVDDLCDGDTLLFEEGKTYNLSEPVYFTSFSGEKFEDETNPENSYDTRTGVTRRFITVNGQGATITGTTELLGANKSLFYYSDEVKYGMIGSIIKNFKFFGNGGNGSAVSAVMADPNVTGRDSVYFDRSGIENCQFYYFNKATYMCGDGLWIKKCRFEECNYGIHSDGSLLADFSHNYFRTTKQSGIHCDITRYSVIHHNRFYKCIGVAIFVAGTFETNPEEREMAITVSNNIISGGEINNVKKNYNGIKFQGVDNGIIKDNYILEMINDPENNDYSSYGCGIVVEGNSNTSASGTESLIFGGVVQVTGNIIWNCVNSCIKVNNTFNSIVSDNILYNDKYYIINDINNTVKSSVRGIVVGEYTGNIVVKDNLLNYFTTTIENTDENSIYIPSGDQCILQDNIIVRRKVFNEATYTIPSITLSSEAISLSPEEDIFVRIPSNYSPAAVTAITYKGRMCMITDSDRTILTYTLPLTDCEKYIRFKFWNDNGMPKFIYLG